MLKLTELAYRLLEMGYGKNDTVKYFMDIVSVEFTDLLHSQEVDAMVNELCTHFANIELYPDQTYYTDDGVELRNNVHTLGEYFLNYVQTLRDTFKSSDNYGRIGRCIDYVNTGDFNYMTRIACKNADLILETRENQDNLTVAISDYVTYLIPNWEILNKLKTYHIDINNSPLEVVCNDYPEIVTLSTASIHDSHVAYLFDLKQRRPYIFKIIYSTVDNPTSVTGELCSAYSN